MTETDRAALRRELIRDEGLRLKPYRDSVGKLTIGVGRCLDDAGISVEEAEVLLANDMRRTESAVGAALPWFTNLDVIRQRVLLNMAFNLGTPGLLKFTHTLDSVRRGAYADAARQMLESKWANQVGRRARRLSRMMELGAEVA